LDIAGFSTSDAAEGHLALQLLDAYPVIVGIGRPGDHAAVAL
jgi:hypothetical protein